MDEQTVEKVKTNLNEMKEYAEKFPDNAGWRWMVESIDKTLVVIEPEEEPKGDDEFDMPKDAQSESITMDASDLLRARPVDEAGNIILEPDKSEEE